MLLKKGAESELHLVDWYGQPAVSKVRICKQYRHVDLDLILRKHRTLHESRIMSFAKIIGVRTPFIYFLNLNNFEIIMEYIDGDVLKNVFSTNICFDLGKTVANLHKNNIIHGDLTTSNFIITPKKCLTVIDFGLSFYSERIEDKASDIRLFKEILNSVHMEFFKSSLENFTQGYYKIYGKNSIKIFNLVNEIEQRGRYSR